MFPKVDGHALRDFYERDDAVVVTLLIESGEGLKLASHSFSTLPPSKGIHRLQSVTPNGESINIFSDLVFKYFRIHQVL